VLRQGSPSTSKFQVRLGCAHVFSVHGADVRREITGLAQAVREGRTLSAGESGRLDVNDDCARRWRLVRPCLIMAERLGEQNGAVENANRSVVPRSRGGRGVASAPADTRSSPSQDRCFPAITQRMFGCFEGGELPGRHDRQKTPRQAALLPQAPLGTKNV